MFDLDKWTEIWATIRRHKLRTGLTMFGVFWGIFMLILLLGAGKGLENGAMKNFNVAKNAVFLWSQRTSIPYKGMKPGRFIQFTNDDITAIRQNIPEVDVIAPSNGMWGTYQVQYQTKSSAFEVRGEYPEFLKVKPNDIPQGRFINMRDIAEKRKVAIIGIRVQELLFGKDDPIGKYINIKGAFFQVVGVAKSRATGSNAMDDAQKIYIPHSAMQQTFNQINKVGFFQLTPKPGVPASYIEQKVKELLAQRHSVSPNDLKAFGSANVEERFKEMQMLFTAIRIFSWVVAIGTIIAGIIGVGNIMLIVVKERTKEIGVRKALGATPWSVISLIIQESVVITAVAGYMGLLAGTGFIALISYLMDKYQAQGDFFSNPEVNLTVALYAMAVLVLTGTLAGLIPAARAAAINPVEALRDE